MARKWVLLDDMEEDEVDADGGTVLFSLDGNEREIDLSKKNAAKLRATLQPWLDRSRPVGKKTTTREPAVKHGASGYDSEQLQAVRNWARKNGWPDLSPRGRVPADVRVAFEAAGGLTIQKPEFSSL
jgi:hypothetical protein